MKHSAYSFILRALTFLFVVSFGCGKDANPLESGGADNLVIEGNLYEWSIQSGFTLKFAEYSSAAPGYTLGHGYVNPKGAFKILVPAPLPTELKSVSMLPQFEIMRGSLEFSDPNAKCYSGFPVIYNGENYIGRIQCNGITDADNFFTVLYYYFDRDVNIKGKLTSHINSDYVMDYDISAKAGWNVIINKVVYNNPDSSLIVFKVEDPIEEIYTADLIED